MSTIRKITLLFSISIVSVVLLATRSGPSLAANPPANPAAPSASLTLLAQQDAYIDESLPTTNYGGEDSLWVGRVSSQLRAPFDLHTLVWFELSALPPGASITAAKLQLYEISATLQSTYAITPDIVLRPWDEMLVTWNNAPPHSNLGDAAVAVDMTNGWKTWDVTNIVKAWLLPNTNYLNYGIRLLGDGSTIGRRQFGSRNDPQLAPRLIVRYTTNPKPTRTPVPTWTPIPTAQPTVGPSPTPTPVFPLFTYYLSPPIFQYYPPTIDLSIAGIELTEGIQCFDTSKGLAGCANNSLPLISKKNATARIYLKYTGSGSSLNNVPVRLHLRANNVWYVVNGSGQARSTLDQSNANYSVNVWFNVDFNSDVNVDYWAEVDPNHMIAETNESNNCYPTPSTCSDSSYSTLLFHKRGTLNVVGQRIRYHPSGYAGNQYAGGWAVNGGGATWWNAVLPLRTNGINYSLNSGYLDWTTPLDGSGQHALISTLNLLWIQQNALSWWFGTGSFTGARHVYGWAPSAGYSGGHADMPVYPH
ncbi:MAG TPA: DNRLRE domain-containing protein, partial [Anaerolineae bacterium]|nr:DNRLRE domain-containing protein [Anaerolineae bacterium]